MRRGSTAAALALSAVLIAGLAPAASAQGNGAAETGEIEITDGLLERVAEAYPVVSAIASEAEPRIEAAETEAVARAIRELAEDRILVALEAVGLTAAEYVAALTKVNGDGALRARLSRLLRAAGHRPG